MGWCTSDLDANIGFFNDIDECWGACTHIFGDVIYSVDFWANEGEMGSCYCQHDCYCMESIGYEENETMTLNSLTELPAPCGEEEIVDDDIVEECSLAVKTEVLMIDAGNVYETSIF